MLASSAPKQAAHAADASFQVANVVALDLNAVPPNTTVLKTLPIESEKHQQYD